MTNTSLTQKILFTLWLSLSLAGNANSQISFADRRPPVGTEHSLPARLFPAHNWWKLNKSGLITRTNDERWGRSESTALDPLRFDDFGSADFEGAFRAATEAGVDALYVVSSSWDRSRFPGAAACS